MQECSHLPATLKDRIYFLSFRSKMTNQIAQLFNEQAIYNVGSSGYQIENMSPVYSLYGHEGTDLEVDSIYIFSKMRL